MLYISMVFSLVLLGVTCCSIRLSQKGGPGSQVAWLFLVPGVGCILLGGFLPVFVLNVVLVGIGGLLCGFFQFRERWYYAACLGATFASYAVGAWFAVGNVREADRLAHVDSMTDRLAYEDRRPNSLWQYENNVDAGTKTRIEQRLTMFDERLSSEEGVAFSRNRSQYRVMALQRLHEDRVEHFVNSPGFGVIRMMPYKRYAKPPEEVTLTMEPLDQLETWRMANKDSQRDDFITASSGLHQASLFDFVNLGGFGWIKDREHVVGFQSHQFHQRPAWDRELGSQGAWTLKRLELVSLLTHDEPGVYISDQLPRMDLLRDVPLRPLDEFEQTSLPQVAHGEEIVLSQTGNRLRMLGEIRAAEQCLSCHKANRGDLLGAFSYHFDAPR